MNRRNISEYLKVLADYAEAGEVPYLSAEDIAEVRDLASTERMRGRMSATLAKAQLDRQRDQTQAALERMSAARLLALPESVADQRIVDRWYREHRSLPYFNIAVLVNGFGVTEWRWNQDPDPSAWVSAEELL